ncbi:MAG: Mut7-C RNAse domain-containing protein [Candidatus Bathyarchaeota archaeon]
MQFISDGMLGKTTRWLRLLGYDVEYAPDLSDDKLIKIARDSGKILLTADLQLYRNVCQKDAKSFLLENNLSEAAKLAKLSRRFNIKLEVDVEISRCPVCNSLLREISKKEISGKIPPESLNRYEDFWVCIKKECGKIYWQGSHWRKITELLKSAKRQMDILEGKG